MLCAALVLSACGGDDAPDADGGLSAKELAAKLPEGGGPRPGSTESSAVVAADVDAARKAAGLEPGTDPTEISTSREELRFGLSTFTALRDLSALTDNPVRAALDHGLISAYAGHTYLSDNAVALLSTSQDFNDIASALEDDGWERDGAVVSTEGNPDELTYTAVGAANGFVVLGYTAEAVEAMASGESPPSESGELEVLDSLDAPVIGATIPGADSAECVESAAFEDFVDESFRFYITVEGKADESNVSKALAAEAESIGLVVKTAEAKGDTVTIELRGRTDTDQLVNSPSVLFIIGFDEAGPPIYNCE